MLFLDEIIKSGVPELHLGPGELSSVVGLWLVVSRAAFVSVISYSISTSVGERTKIHFSIYSLLILTEPRDDDELNTPVKLRTP